MKSRIAGSAILRFTNPKVQPKVISLIVFIDLDNLRHRFRPNGGRGMEMRHGARRRGVTIAELGNLNGSIPSIHPLGES